MFIETEQTPNPATLKFLPGRSLMGAKDAVEFTSWESAQSSSPLAAGLFMVEGVKGVFFGSDFISITKEEGQEWYVLKPSILGIIMEHFATNQAIFNEGYDDEGTQSAMAKDGQPAKPIYEPEDEEVVQKIETLLNTRVRPAVAQDGGDIVFHGFDKGIVYLTMRGACAGCPSSTATLKMGIENMLRHYIPEVVEVRPTNG